MRSLAAFMPIFGLFLAFFATQAIADVCPGEAALKRDPPAIVAIRRFIRANTASHSIRRANGTYTLKVGALAASEYHLMVYVAAAIYEGSLTRIEAGEVLSPRILVLLNQLSEDLKRRGLSVDVRGILIPQVVENNAVKEHLVGYDRALAEFKIKEACRELYKSDSPTKCDDMRFQVQLGRAQAPSWSKPR